jgi:hypothetical protein
MKLNPGAYMMLGLCLLFFVSVLLILLWARRHMVEGGDPAPGPPAPSYRPPAPLVVIPGGAQGGPAPIPSWAGMAGPRQWFEVVVDEPPTPTPAPTPEAKPQPPPLAPVDPAQLQQAVVMESPNLLDAARAHLARLLEEGPTAVPATSTPAPAPAPVAEESPWLSREWKPEPVGVKESSPAPNGAGRPADLRPRHQDDPPELVEAARSGVGIRKLRERFGIGYKRAARVVETYGRR